LGRDLGGKATDYVHTEKGDGVAENDFFYVFVLVVGIALIGGAGFKKRGEVNG